MRKNIIEIPATLNIDEILAANPPEKNLKKDRLLYFIHLVYYMHVMNPDNVLNAKTRLHSQILKKIIGKDYIKYVNYLIENNLIIKSKHFSPNNTSYTYEMGNINLTAIHHKTVILNDKTLLDNIEKAEKEYYTISVKVKNNYMYLKKWFNKKLTAEIPENILSHHKYQLKNINESRYRMSIDDFGKRLHTNLTNLPKELRKCLRYDGNILVEVDIKNSQFYFVIKFVLDYVKSNNPKLYNDLISLDNDIDKLKILKQSVEYKDAALYIKDATSLEFYENIGRNFYLKFGFELTRDSIKDYMFESIFSKSKSKSRIKTIFKEMYPLVYEILDDKKKNNSLEKDKHKALSKSLQRLESSLVLRTICKNPLLIDIPIFTIHDAILTTNENVPLVKEIIETTLYNSIHFKPNVKVKELQ